MQSKYIITEMVKSISRAAMIFMPCMLSSKQPHTASSIYRAVVWTIFLQMNFSRLHAVICGVRLSGPNPPANSVANIIRKSPAGARIKIARNVWAVWHIAKCLVQIARTGKNNAKHSFLLRFIIFCDSLNSAQRREKAHPPRGVFFYLISPYFMTNITCKKGSDV